MADIGSKWCPTYPIGGRRSGQAKRVHTNAHTKRATGSINDETIIDLAQCCLCIHNTRFRRRERKQIRDIDFHYELRLLAFFASSPSPPLNLHKTHTWSACKKATMMKNTHKHNRRHLTITECLRKCNIGCKTILSSLNGIIPCNYLKANLMVVKLGGSWFFSTYMNFGERWISSAMLVEVMSLILPKPIYTNRTMFAPFHLWVIVYAHFLAKYSLILWALIHMIMALSISIKPS